MIADLLRDLGQSEEFKLDKITGFPKSRSQSVQQRNKQLISSKNMKNRKILNSVLNTLAQLSIKKRHSSLTKERECRFKAKLTFGIQLCQLQQLGRFRDIYF